MESYKQLSPDQGTLTIDILTQISLQLSAMANGSQSTTAALAVTQTPFQANSSAIRVNAFWFLSLIFAISCALMATLVEQWARQYIQATDKHPIPHERARIRSYLYEGIDAFHVAAMVEGIPTLLHIAVFLFFAGLVQFLLPINTTVAFIVLSFVIICGALYLAATILPILVRNCPYRTPVSSLIWRVMGALRLLMYLDDEGKIMLLRGNSIAEGREFLAMNSPQHAHRDLAALRFTLNSLINDSDFERFIEAIPAFVQPSIVSDGHILVQKLLCDPQTHFGSRLENHFSPHLLPRNIDPNTELRRRRICLEAVFSIISRNSSLELPWISMFTTDFLRAIVDARDYIYFPNHGGIAFQMISRCICAIVGHNLIKQIIPALQVSGPRTVEREHHGSLMALLILRADKYIVEAAQFPDRSSFLQRNLTPLHDVLQNPGDNPSQSHFSSILNTSLMAAFVDFIGDPLFGQRLPESTLPMITSTIRTLSTFNAGSTSHETQMRLVRFIGRAMLGSSGIHSLEAAKPPKPLAYALLQACFTLRDPTAIEEALKIYARYQNVALEALPAWVEWMAVQNSLSDRISTYTFEQLLGTASLLIRSLRFDARSSFAL